MINPSLNTLCILYGGKSSEHDVSLRSAASVLRHAPWDSKQIILIGIDRTGVWKLQNSLCIDAVRSGADLTVLDGPLIITLPSQGLHILKEGKLEQLAIDIIFPVMHGTFCEDGTLQGYLEIADIPYVGSGVLGSALGMDKEKVKEVWIKQGLATVDFKLIKACNWQKETGLETYQNIVKEFGTTLFIKPSRCGSSVGISKVSNAIEFIDAVEKALIYDSKILIEPAIDAREIEVSVVGNDLVTSYGPGEIVPEHHSFYDYDAKYLDPDGARLLIPAALNEEEQARVRSLAEKAYIACEARGFSRVDFFLDRKTGQLLLNEINTLPGFTNISMFPMMCEFGGLSYSDLIYRLCELGLEEHSVKQKIHFTKN